MAQPSVVCPDPFDALTIATEHLGTEIYKRASVNMAYWMNLIPRSEFESGTGLTHTTFTTERSEPTTDEREWTAVQSVAAATPSPTGSACATTWNDVKYGHTTRLYSPEQLGLRSPAVCKDELIYTHQAERFFETYLHALSINSQRELENRLQNVYMHLVPKNLATSSYPKYDGGSLDADHTPPTSPTMPTSAFPTLQLEQGMLDLTAAELNTDGAHQPDDNGFISLGDDGPIYTLLIGQQMSMQLSLNNSEFRKDSRYAEPSMLLKRMGATKVIKNFRHLVTLTPPRWDAVGNQWFRQSAWEMVPASKGYKARMRQAYIDAQFEGAIVLNPWVFHQEVIRPVNSAASMTWMPTNYFGEWQFVTGGKEIFDANEGACYDPLKKQGRHFGEYKDAKRVIFPEFGRVILFNRCNTSSFQGVSCAGVS